jgi:hypothetical protein
VVEKGWSYPRSSQVNTTGRIRSSAYLIRALISSVQMSSFIALAIAWSPRISKLPRVSFFLRRSVARQPSSVLVTQPTGSMLPTVIPPESINSAMLGSVEWVGCWDCLPASLRGFPINGWLLFGDIPWQKFTDAVDRMFGGVAENVAQVYFWVQPVQFQPSNHTHYR